MTVMASSHQNGQVLKLERPYYEQEQLNTELNYSKPEKHETVTSICCNNFHPKQCFLKTFPIITWLSQYNFKADLLGDIVSGCTVAVMHIPQGMGYALLANVPPILGIYTAFFPVLVYCIFGTSRHNSMGTFAVITIMIGKVVSSYEHSSLITNGLNNTILIEDTASHGIPQYSATQIASTLCLIVGIMQLMMYIFRLGIISSLLSETLVSGFTTGAAVHVLTSQVKDLLGIQLTDKNEFFKIIYTYIEVFENIFRGQVNGAAIIISVITLIILVINNEAIKPRLSKKCFIPIPIELICVIGGVVVANYLSLTANWNVTAIGHIPTGFPAFEEPKFELMSEMILSGFTIAMVSYTVSVSMALIFAQKLNYEIDFNQELLAMGGANVIGSFLSCFPLAASLSRSTIQQTVGGRTQLASLISCSLLIFVLLWIGPFFEPLPRCVLSSIIVVALKGMLLQTKDFIKFYRLSHLDAFVWIITFLSVVIVAIDIGLAVGIVMSIACIFIRGMKPYTCLLGNVPKTDLYLDITRYKAAEEIPSIKIFHYCGSLNFASRNAFKIALCSLIGLNLAKETKKMLKTERYDPIYLKCLVLDFSALSYIDPSGVTALILLVKEFNKLQINVFIAGCSCPAYETMKKCGLKESLDGWFKFFPTVHDAVHYAQESVLQISIITSL